MRRMKVIPLILLVTIIVMQFIRPARNESGQVLPTDINRIYTVPEDVKAVLRASCYDCHSNNTHYPWYAEIQPMGWWLASHIKKGKSELNFDEFGEYSERSRDSKLKSIANSIKDGTMPLPAYTLIHAKAKLSKKDKAIVQNWVETTRDSLSQKN